MTHNLQRHFGKSSLRGPLVAHLAILILTGILLAMPATTMADWNAREVVKIHQNRFDLSNDLHVKFWQKEDNIDILSWELGPCEGLPAPTINQRGLQPERYHSRLDNHPDHPPTNDPDNGNHAIDLGWDDLNIPFCQHVKIPFSWTLEHRNKKHIDVVWTKDPDAAAKHVAKNGWEVDPPVPAGGGMFKHTVHICNLDLPDDPPELEPMALNVRGLRFATIEGLRDVTYSELDNWTDWTDAPLTIFELQPGECYSFDVVTSWEHGHLLGNFELFEPGGGLGGDDWLVYETFDHPTETIPEPAGLFLITLFITLRRRAL